MGKEEKRVLTLDKYEHGVVVNALNEMRNDLLEEQRSTDIVDEVLLKAIDAPTKKVKCRDEARYGFEGRVEWCACFVSWCANECGYIENGIIPKFAGCVNGVQWFKDRGQWADNSIEPTPGMIIFFDWDSPNGSSGPQDGQSDHVGIVEKCENGIVYTIEGNSGDSCRQRQYSVGYYEILGYGIPAY